MEDPTEAVILVAMIELLAVKIQPWAPLTAMSSQERARKRFTNQRSRDSRKYQQRQDCKKQES